MTGSLRLCKLTVMGRVSKTLRVVLWLLVAWAGVQMQASAAVLRCIAADGGVSYQDKSCPNGARGDPVDATPNQGFRFATRAQIDKAMRAPPDDPPPPRARSTRAKVKTVFNADERRFMRTGMHLAEVRRRIGPPDQIAHPSSATGRRLDRNASQQWVYLPADQDPQTTTVLTVRRGMVLHVDRKVSR